MSDMETGSEPFYGGELVISEGPRSDQLAHREHDRRRVLLNRWLLAQRSENTRTAYRNDLLDFFAWADEWRADLGGLGVFEFQRAQIDAYHRFLESADHEGMRYRSKTKYAPSTVARKLTALSSFYGYLGDEEGHPSNPVARVKRPPVDSESQTTGLSIDEVGRLLAVADETPRNSALVRLLLGTGLRVSEVVRADTGDLDRDRGRPVIRVTRKGGKRETVPMPDSADRAVRAYLGPRRGPLFLDRHRKRATRNQVAYWLKTLTAAAGVPGTLTPHGLRHTMATLALDAGATLRDVQQQLGHADPKTTIRYDRARTRLDNSALRAISAILDG
jgi:site-specific recombinase XerD